MDGGILNFWGPVTASIDWCEKNYVYSPYVAEFYNTISSIPTIMLAIFGVIVSLSQGFEKRFTVLHLSNMILGMGSILFHGTLQHVLQQSDETPMVWEMLLYIFILYSPDWHYRSTMPTFLFLYGIIFAVVHSLFHLGISFKVHYAVFCLLCAPRMYKYYIHMDDLSAKRLAKFYVATLFLGSLCWICDRLFCEQISGWSINPQGHALWHIFIGFNAYFANAFLMFCRAQQRGWSPRIVHFLGLLPYVKIDKPKTQ